MSCSIYPNRGVFYFTVALTIVHFPPAPAVIYNSQNSEMCFHFHKLKQSSVSK